VRQLAQRSAGAARDIQSLIVSAAEKRQHAGVLAQHAGDTMEKVVESVRSVTVLMNDIARASREQRAGIEQVSAGVAQMERVTQQNAGMVEEAAAATDALEERARGLVEVVGRFRLGSAGGASVKLPGVATSGAMRLVG